MPTLDRPRLESLAAHLLANADRHDQEQFAARTACGTWYCAAGWTPILDGGYDINWCEYDGEDSTDEIAGRPMTAIANTAYDRRAQRFVDIDEAATELLGLDVSQRGRLFYNFGGTDEIVSVIKGFLDEAA